MYISVMTCTFLTCTFHCAQVLEFLWGTTGDPKFRAQKRFLFPLLVPPPWPQHFDQPPLPNRLPRSQFLSILDQSSGKTYLPPLTNASITCESPSSRRRPLELDHRTKSTSILFLCHPPEQIASPEVNSCPFWTGQVAKYIYRP
jgi:hypothetical protein